jgi:hypothetical protein
VLKPYRVATSVLAMIYQSSKCREYGLGSKAAYCDFMETE